MSESTPLPEFQVDRREFVRTLLAALPLAATFDGSLFPRRADAQPAAGDGWDAVVIGAGLGGLSCAAAFARQGFRPLVLEMHDQPGGYATTFRRPGGFEFDVSLHSTSAGARDGAYNLIPGFPEITEVEFVPHPSLYRAVFPEHDITVSNRDPDAYVAQLKALFPEESAGIDGLVAAMRGIRDDAGRLAARQGRFDYASFPVEFPHLFRAVGQTWGQLVDAHLKSPTLKAIVGVQWGYYGLPPSRLASIYYALPAIGFLEQGGFYPRGRSAAISGALAKFIESHGGKLMLGTRVERILLDGGAATGVRTADGKEHRGKVVVSNANAWDTFHRLLEPGTVPAEYMARMDGYSVSLSSFQVWLGLKDDLVGRLGLRDSEIFCERGYDPESSFATMLRGEIGEDAGFGLTLYDNIYDGYSPPGKNTIGLITLMGYDPWLPFEADYLRGEKEAYRKEKERIADRLIAAAERRFLPGLREAIEVREAATPLTNLRYTGNYRGGIYGWDQTLGNAMPSRMAPVTPIPGLYLASAWTQPGGGYGGVLWSGLQCFGEIMRRWG